MRRALACADPADRRHARLILAKRPAGRDRRGRSGTATEGPTSPRQAVAPPCDGFLLSTVGTSRADQPRGPAPRTGQNGSRPYNPSAMADTPLPDLILYGRAECGLCAEAR